MHLHPSLAFIDVCQVVAKKKLVESAPEPYHVEIFLSQRSIELWLSAVVDYCRCSLAEQNVHFRDTLMFQTRIYKYATIIIIIVTIVIICSFNKELTNAAY